MLPQAKQDTVEKVCQIVKKQLAVPDNTEVCGATKFSDLGADSLDTVTLPTLFWLMSYMQVVLNQVATKPTCQIAKDSKELHFCEGFGS